jgi:hypothetical protein
MTWTTVPVPVAIVGRQQPVNGIDEIEFAPRTGLDQRQPGRGVRYEKVTESVTATFAVPLNMVRDVGNQIGSRAQVKSLTVHESIIPFALIMA